MRTQVGILGAGPAGLMLAHLLHLEGIDTVVLERHTRDYVEKRVRAGVLEQGSVDLMIASGLGERLQKEGLVHEGIEILFDGQRHRIDLAALSGRRITVYGQQETVKDMVAARTASGAPLLFEAECTSIEGLDGNAPSVRFRHEGQAETLECEFVAGCDGFHGISRATIPKDKQQIFERVYPFAWLGILAEAAPVGDELVYASHEEGFALFSMRSPEITRLYLQCAPDEDLDEWSDDRIWGELMKRLACHDGWRPNVGPILQKGVTPMRSFVCETMRHGRLFLAGDAAHIVPPTGAKGMNLALSDVRYLARAFVEHYRSGNDERFESYARKCLDRIWRAEHFSWWMTSMLHRFEEYTPFQARIQRAELAYVTSSKAAASALAENYVGLPWQD